MLRVVGPAEPAPKELYGAIDQYSGDMAQAQNSRLGKHVASCIDGRRQYMYISSTYRQSPHGSANRLAAMASTATGTTTAVAPERDTIRLIAAYDEKAHEGV